MRCLNFVQENFGLNLVQFVYDLHFLRQPSYLFKTGRFFSVDINQWLHLKKSGCSFSVFEVLFNNRIIHVWTFVFFSHGVQYFECMAVLVSKGEEGRDSRYRSFGEHEDFQKSVKLFISRKKLVIARWNVFKYKMANWLNDFVPCANT